MTETISLPRERTVGNSVWTLVEGEQYYVHICGKCGGSGYIPHYGFNANGLCFQCNGAGKTQGRKNSTQLDSMQAAFDRREAVRESKRLAECAKRDARVEAFLAAEPVLAAVLKAEYDNFQNDGKVNRFYLSLAEQLHNVVGGRDLTDNQISALRRSVEQAAEREAHKGENPVVEGRIEIHGTIISTKEDDGMYGTTYKMLVEDERGFRVFGSIPQSFWDEVAFLGSYRKSAWGETDGVMTKLKGMEVRFTATVEKSDKDESFGFFKRPTKASVVA